MTCIVGLEYNGKVYMGGDSAGTETLIDDISSFNEEKVFINGNLIIGYTKSFRLGQLLQYYYEPPYPKKSKTDKEHVIIDVVGSMKKLLVKNEFKIETGDNIVGQMILVGYKGKLYNIGNEFYVLNSMNGYDSVGSGYALACGAMHVTKDLKMKPEDRILGALSAATAHTTGVRPPYIVKHI